MMLRLALEARSRAGSLVPRLITPTAPMYKLWTGVLV